MYVKAIWISGSIVYYAIITTMNNNLKDKTKRVRFFSTTDLSCGFYLAEVENILNKLEEPKTVIDTIELYHVKQYVDSKIFKLSWNNNSEDYYQKIAKTIPKNINIFFTMHQHTMASEYEKIDIFEYRVTFFEILINYKFIRSWSEDVVIAIFENTDLRVLLQFTDIVKRFGSYIRDRIVSSFEAADIIISKLSLRDDLNYPINLPDELSVEDISEILLNYIKSDNPDITILQGIILVQDSILRNPNKIKYLAKKRSDELEAVFFSCQENYFSHGVGVKYEEGQATFLEIKREKDVDVYSYDLSWILHNTDYPTLLNNFIYLFQYVDDGQFRCTINNNPNLLGVFERFALATFKGAYNPGSIFHYKLGLARLQMGSYYNLLKVLKGIRLEEVFSFFFKEYLSTEFDIESYQISMPSAASTFFEKCKAIAPEMDRVLKELDCLKSEGYIEPGMIEISSSSKPLEAIPSLLNKKYYVGLGNEFQNASYYLCSDQCMLHYLENYKDRHYNSFYKLVIENEIFFDDYTDIYKQNLSWLKERDFIIIDESGRITLTKRSTIIVDLFRNQTINYWHYPKQYREIVDVMLNQGYLSQENLFFSKPERDFFNFILNNRSFTDSLALRNKYSHGTSAIEEGNERFHEENYYLFLLLLAIIIIKINDELCIRELRDYIEENSKALGSDSLKE